MSPGSPELRIVSERRRRPQQSRARTQWRVCNERRQPASRRGALHELARLWTRSDAGIATTIEHGFNEKLYFVAVNDPRLVDEQTQGARDLTGADAAPRTRPGETPTATFGTGCGAGCPGERCCVLSGSRSGSRPGRSRARTQVVLQVPGRWRTFVARQRVVAPDYSDDPAKTRTCTSPFSTSPARSGACERRGRGCSAAAGAAHAERGGCPPRTLGTSPG